MTVFDPKAEAGRKLTGRWPSSLSFTVPAVTAEWVSVGLGGMLFALIGIAFAWSLGYIVSPQAIEFWQAGEFRLHDRFVYRRDDGGLWVAERLSP